MNTHRTLSVLFATSLTAWAVAADTTPKPAEPGTLLVLDAAGKEQKLKAWKFTGGVRRLTWLAPAKAAETKDAADKDKKPAPKGKRTVIAPVGPEALSLRAETGDGLFAEGVLTLIPLDRLRALDYDNEENTVTVDAGEKLIGTTKYKQINKLVIEAEVDKGELGIAEIKYLGGYPHGIRGVRFPAPKAAPPPPDGRRVLVVSADSKSSKTTHKVVDLLPLYRLPDGGEKLLPTLMFKKTLKLDVGKIKKIVTAGAEEGAWQVTLKDGGDETLTLLETIPFEGKQARLLGFVGRVPVGYKLFPSSAIAEITFDATEDK
ncbi:MAG TPA: hypothetical protein VN688_14310 [Gemmataceae bacterium]|nr:hypothetical protein [Gemmataceae bacterium]